MLFKNVHNAANKIAPIFEEMGWTWGDKKPNKDDILDELLRLTENMDADKNCVSISSGRLCAIRIRDTKEMYIGLAASSHDEWVDSHA